MGIYYSTLEISFWFIPLPTSATRTIPSSHISHATYSSARSLPYSKTSRITHFIMSLDHPFALSGPAVNQLIEDPRWTQQKILKIHGASFHTLHTFANDYNDDTRAWAKLMNRESGEDENDGTHPKMGQMETPTRPEGKPIDNNVVPSHTSIKSTNAAQVSCTTKQVVAKEISKLAVDSLNCIVQYA